MKYLIFIVALLASSSHADFYIKIGTGYKFVETDELTVAGVDYTVDDADPISARIEIGQERGNWSYGVSHHSQWATGAPFNDKKEYFKTEVFIDYKFEF